MSPKPITSVDVARLAGVSQPTVSRAFDEDASVAPETRARVLAAADELGYRPNAIARSLSTQRSDIVGVVMANMTNSLFYPTLLDKLIEQLQAHGRQSLLFNAPTDRPVDEILPRILGYQVDALVIASTTPSNTIIDECTRQGTPVILFNRIAPDTSASSVCCDNVAGAQMAADLLLDHGHQRFAYIAGIASSSTNSMRSEGFADRLRARGVDDILLDRGKYTYVSGYAAATRLLGRPDRPDAIFCAADIMALGAIDAAKALGISVPEELSIIGFDDIPVSRWPAFDLTTIRQPTASMVDTVVSLITTPDSPTGQTHLLPGELVVRGSVRLTAGA